MKNNRKPNIKITEYPNLINPTISNIIANRVHNMADMPYYHKNNEPNKLHEEEIVENRYNELFDSYIKSTKINPSVVNPVHIMLDLSMNQIMIGILESPHRNKLIDLAEKIVRKEFNVDYDEVIFDLEIIDTGNIELPSEANTKKNLPENFKQTDDLDVLKKRTINALSQGSALSFHYIFHVHSDEFNNITKDDVVKFYHNALIANDLFFFLNDDNEIYQNINNGNAKQISSYCHLKFDGDIPVIEVKANNTPLLMHEMVKGLINLFSIEGIQNMSQDVIDETDYIMSELWDIRFGPTLWRALHSLIDIQDYDIKKLIFVEIFKMESEFFVKEFMFNVLNKPESAKNTIQEIVKKIRNKIMEYEFEKDSDGFDLTDLGFF